VAEYESQPAAEDESGVLLPESYLGIDGLKHRLGAAYGSLKAAGLTANVKALVIDDAAPLNLAAVAQLMCYHHDWHSIVQAEQALSRPGRPGDQSLVGLQSVTALAPWGWGVVTWYLNEVYL